VTTGSWTQRPPSIINLKIMASAFHDPLSPFSDPHRDAPWPTTPHTTADLPPTLVRNPSAHSQVAPIDTGISSSTNGVIGTGPWGKEPQIYGQPEPGLISPQTTKPSNGQPLEKPEPYLRVRITALDRNRRDTLVRFDAQVSLHGRTRTLVLTDTQTNLSNFTGTTYRNISRTYAEFQRFYEQIVYSNPQTIIPALPLPQTAAPTDDEGAQHHSVHSPFTHFPPDDRLVKVMLQRWFTRVCEDPILLNDEELRSFIESDFGVRALVSTVRPPSHVLIVSANAAQTPPNRFRVQPLESPPP
jgi:PX domain